MGKKIRSKNICELCWRKLSGLKDGKEKMMKLALVESATEIFSKVK